MFDIITRVEEKLTLAVEFNGLRWLIDAISTLKVFLGTLGKFSTCSVHDLVQVVHLAELTLWVGSSHDSTLTGSQQETSWSAGLEHLVSAHCKVLQHFNSE